MFQPDLQTRLGRVGEEPAGETEQDLGADDAGLGVVVGTATVVDQEPERDHEQTGSADDEDLQAFDVVNHEAEQETCDDGGEAVQGRDACCTGDAEVKGYDEHGVQVVGLHAPGPVEAECDAEGPPDAAVFHKNEGDERVGCIFEFPDCEDRDADNTDDQRCKDVGGRPLVVNALGGEAAAGDGERCKDHGENSDQQNNANDVELPEELDHEPTEAKLLERS